MLFASHSFLIFLFIVTVAYYCLIPTKYKISSLILASVIFYAWWSIHHLVLLLGSILFNYLISLLIASSNRKVAWLAVGVSCNLLLLGIFKYTDFVLQSMNGFFAMDFQPVGIILPLAISFFTFQQIAYLVDVSRGQVTSHSFRDYVLFVSFFPQLIAGPIVHHREMMPQFAKRLRPSETVLNLTVGLTLFAIGLFKKIVLADQFGLYADKVFDAVGYGYRPSAAEAWSGSLAYSLQIYFDFSGYCDMAMGIARMFGIRLPINFFSPYKARSIVDFWRRWHITLSRFLRDYLYIPLGGNRRGNARRCANLMITMLLGGLWHGAGWTFIIWGGLHGAYLIVNHGWNALTASDRPLASLAVIGRLAGPGLTFLAVIVAWVFFRAESFDDAWLMISAMAGAHEWQPEAVSLSMFKDAEMPIWLAVGLAIVWFMPNSLQIMRRYRPAIDPSRVASSSLGSSSGVLGTGSGWTNGVTLTWRPTTGWALLSGLVAGAAIIGISKVSPFLYFQF
jgi:D-alanyl-lipoteichoic acid acyltransferase DltB (MBOAT superfamily)